VNLAEEYDRLSKTPSDIVGHLPRFVDMVHHHNATHVIELGTRSGVSTIAWLYGLVATGGHLWSVDIDPAPSIGEHCNWTFIQGDDLDPATIAQLPAVADIVFIDTSHFYEQTAAELAAYAPLVRSGGLIVCHDTRLAVPDGAPPRPLFPVRKAIGEFVKERDLTWTEYRDSFGLGVIEMG
jgi:cephalosporin hydroxylase